MASSTTVTATIAAIDQASPVIDALLKHIHSAGAETDKLAAKSTAAMEEHGRRLDSMSAKFGRFYGAADKAAAGFAAGFGSHFLKEASHVAEEMSKLERKMVAFGGLTKAQAADMRKQADSTFSGLTGGPVGQIELQNQLLSNGIRADQVSGMEAPISMYANETGQGLAEAATEFTGHMAMLHRIHDDMGREVAFGAATAQQTKVAAEETFGALTTYFKEMQGSFADVMAFSKVAGPSTNMLKIPEHYMFAEEAVLSQQGIRGEVAGTAVAGINRRLIDRTAKSRAAMAEAGLKYSDYVKLDPNLMTAEGTIAAFEARAGTASAAERAKIKASVAQFQKDHDFDRFNTGLTDDFTTSGNKGLQNRVAAANAAGDITKGAVVGVDEMKFFQDAHDKNLPVGLYNTIFRESANAAMLLAQNIDELKRVQGVYDKGDPQRAYDRAKAEQVDNYAGAKQNVEGAWTGLQSEAFSPLEGPLTHIFNITAEGIREVAGAGESAKTFMDAILVSGVAIGSLKTAGTLANIAGGFMKLATGAEEVGPLVGALGLLADVPFLPIVAGIGAVVAGFEAFEHRAELWHKFELWKNGDSDAPTSPEEAQAMRDKVAADRKAITDRRAEIEQHPRPSPEIIQAQDAANQILRRIIGDSRNNPEVLAAEKAREAAGREVPTHDPAYFAARDAAAQAHTDFAKRAAMAAHDGYVKAIDSVIKQMGSEDPSANDHVLGGLQAHRSDLKSQLPTGTTTSAEIEALDGQIVKRMAENQARLDAALENERKLREQAIDAMGAPKVSQADVDKADKAKDAALDAAKAKQEADRAAADDSVKRSLAAVVDNARQSPDYKAAQARVDQLRDRQRAEMDRHADADPQIAGLKTELAKLEGRVADYDRSTSVAFAMSHPTFTRPNMGLGEGPVFDPTHMAPHAAGSAFGLNGPAVDRSADVIAAIRGSLADRGPVKVDPVHVSGEVKGTAEVAITNAVTVTASPLLTARLDRVEHIAAHVSLSGRMGDEMAGSNGARTPAPHGGIGHN